MSGSVTAWLGSMKAGDQDAVSCLWKRYYERMLLCARRTVDGFDLGGLDEEDIASMAFTQFAESALDGKFPQLVNRNQLWKLLSIITSRTAHGRLTRELAIKRGGVNRARATEMIDHHPTQEPTPRSIVIANDELIRLLESLGEPELQEVALLSMKGFSTKEITHMVGSTQRTIQRMLVLIRDCWAAEAKRIGAEIDLSL